MADTPNFHWTKPDVGGSNSVWGTILDTLFDAADASLKTVSDVASAALARAGGTMTGILGIKTATEARQDLGNITGATALDLAVSQHKTATVTGVTTLSISNFPAGASIAVSLTLKLTNGGAFAVTFPASFKWPGGSAPALTAAGVDLIVAVTLDGGATWQANALIHVA